MCKDVHPSLGYGWAKLLHGISLASVCKASSKSHWESCSFMFFLCLLHAEIRSRGLCSDYIVFLFGFWLNITCHLSIKDLCFRHCLWGEEAEIPVLNEALRSPHSSLGFCLLGLIHTVPITRLFCCSLKYFGHQILAFCAFLASLFSRFLPITWRKKGSGSFWNTCLLNFL